MSINEQAALYRRWNPTSLDDICGNAISVAKCKKLITDTVPSKRPGFYLFTGLSGTGKSTLAHILFNGFGCGDIRVYNSRECGKVGFVGDFLRDEINNPSLMSASRAFIFEEAHNINNEAQEMFMEPLEKGIPSNTFVAFVTNSPEKLTGGKGALISRPFRIDTVAVSAGDMLERLQHINEHEPLGLTEEEVRACAASARGSVRVAINNMSRLAMIPQEYREAEINRIRLDADISSTDVPPDLKELAVAIETGSWDIVAPILFRLRAEGGDPEGLRRGLLAWHSGILLSDKPFCRKKRANSLVMLAALRDNYYNTGFAGLVCDLAHLMRTGIK